LINDNFGEERERENPSTYLPLLDYIKAYDDYDRGKKCKKTAECLENYNGIGSISEKIMGSYFGENCENPIKFYTG
jgi:hypothetical protein